MPRLTTTTLLLTTLLVTSCGLMREMGIGKDPAVWRDATYEDMNRADLIQLVSTVITQGRDLTRQDPQTGDIETSWTYGRYAQGSHKQLRQRVFAKVLRGEDEGSLLVRVRVQQEISDDPGFLQNPGNSEWKTHSDDAQEAALIQLRLKSLLYGLSEEDSGDADGAPSTR